MHQAFVLQPLDVAWTAPAAIPLETPLHLFNIARPYASSARRTIEQDCLFERAE
jgi:hypothetical protein